MRVKELAVILAALMGFRAGELRLGGRSERWLMRRLGLTVHVSSFGMMLMALMATPLGGASWSS